MAISTAKAGTDTGADAAAAALTDAIRVAVPERGLRQDLRAVSIVWRRELIRFRSDRLRAVTSLVQPVLFLFVLGTGLSTLASRGMPPGVNFKTFIYPGVVAMSVLFTAIFSAASIVWDREFGFLREMLVAPVSRAALVLGKCLGGTTVATFQGLVMLALAGFAGVPYSPALMATLIGELLLLSFTLTAFGVMMAARIKQIQAFMALTQMLVMPLFFLSGALYPLGGLPSWLTVLTRIDPLTYIVAPMRDAVFSHLSISPQARTGRAGGTGGRPPGPVSNPAKPRQRRAAESGPGWRRWGPGVRPARVTAVGPRGGYGGSSPWTSVEPREAAPAASRRKKADRVATGANHPARDHRRSDGGPERRHRCSDGGPEHQTKLTPNTPLVRQDSIEGSTSIASARPESISCFR